MKKILFPAIASTLLFACQPSEKKEERTTADTTASPKIETIAPESPKAKLDSAWANYSKFEDNQIRNLEILLREVGYNSKHSPKKLQEAESLLVAIKESRYGQSNIPDFDSVGVLDDLTYERTNQILVIAEETPDMDARPLYHQLVEEIGEYRDQLIRQRTTYSDQVLDYNKTVKNEGEQLPNFYAD